MMCTKMKSFIGLHIMFLFYSFVIIVSKIASGYPVLSWRFLFLYGIELVMIAIYAYEWQKVIKGLTLGVAYSNKGVVIFWTLIWSFLFFNEAVRLNHIIGMIIIILGIILVSKNDK